jgi:RNA polymerase sigma factor (TIGR02999 family)
MPASDAASTAHTPVGDEITRLLRAAREGNASAEQALAPAIYRELHALAHRQMSVAAGGTALQTTALLHEAYLKLLGGEADFPDRGHFDAYASTAMRSIVMDDARRRLARKRGGGAAHITLSGVIDADVASPEQVLHLDQILTSLEQLDPRLLKLVELRVFGGLGVEEAGQALGLSERTVKRDWRRARAFIGERLERAAG